MPSIALATSPAFATLTTEDRLLCNRLSALGVAARPAIWDDPTEAWDTYDLVIIRSCWDYHLRPDAFRRWLAAREDQGVRLWNPPALVRWNMDKGYLRDLAERGVLTIPTAWVEQGSTTSLVEILRRNDWHEAVVKPRISASARGTWRVSHTDAPAQEAAFRRQSQEVGLLVQPFLPQIATEGEWSLVFFDGNFSHVLLKQPRPGDFRVQEEHGGHIAVTRASTTLIRQAHAVLAAIDQTPLYARIDGVLLNDRFHLMELELIEPALYTATLPDAVERFAAAVLRVM